MNKTSIILGLVALLFAGTTLLFWSEGISDAKIAEARATQDKQNLQELASERAALSEKLRLENSGRTASERQSAEIKKELEAAQNAVEKITASSTKEITAAKRLNDKYEQQLEAAAREAETTKTDMERAKTEATELEKKLTEARALVESLNVEVASLRDETGVNALAVKIATLENELKKARASGIGELQEKIKALESTIEALKLSSAQDRQTIKAHEGTIAQLLEENEKLGKENKRLKTPPRRVGSGLGIPDTH